MKTLTRIIGAFALVALLVTNAATQETQTVNRVLTYATIADMQAETLPSDTLERAAIVVLGEAGGRFRYDADDVTDQDFGTILNGPGDVGRFFRQGVNGKFKVDWFGAIPNDDLDDWQAIQYAMLAAVAAKTGDIFDELDTAGGPSVEFGSGVYHISQPIIIGTGPDDSDSKLTIWGQGYFSSVIAPMAGSTNAEVPYLFDFQAQNGQTGNRSWIIEHLQLNGINGEDIRGVDAKLCSYFTIRNCSFHYLDRGINYRNWSNLIQDCIFRFCYDGIYITDEDGIGGQSTINDLRIEGCIFGTCLNAGIRQGPGVDINYIKITDCQFDGLAPCGVLFNGPSDMFIIDNCYFELAGRSGPARPMKYRIRDATAWTANTAYVNRDVVYDENGVYWITDTAGTSDNVANLSLDTGVPWQALVEPVNGAIVIFPTWTNTAACGRITNNTFFNCNQVQNIYAEYSRYLYIAGNKGSGGFRNHFLTLGNRLQNYSGVGASTFSLAQSIYVDHSRWSITDNEIWSSIVHFEDLTDMSQNAGVTIVDRTPVVDQKKSLILNDLSDTKIWKADPPYAMPQSRVGENGIQEFHWTRNASNQDLGVIGVFEKTPRSAWDGTYKKIFGNVKGDDGQVNVRFDVIDGRRAIQRFSMVDSYADSYSFDREGVFQLEPCSPYDDWEAGTVYSAGDIVRSRFTDDEFICTVGGTAAGTDRALNGLQDDGVDKSDTGCTWLQLPRSVAEKGLEWSSGTEIRDGEIVRSDRNGKWYECLTTHTPPTAAPTFSPGVSVNFVDSNPDTIVGTWSNSDDFEADRFIAGQMLEIRNADQAGNNGFFRIASVSGNTITLEAGEALVADTGDANATLNATNDDRDLVNGSGGGTWQEVTGDPSKETVTIRVYTSPGTNGSFTGTSMDFVNSNPDTIVGTWGSSDRWGDDNFVAGQRITIENASNSANNGTYTVVAVDDDTLTLHSEDSLTADTGDASATATGTVNATNSALTNFAISDASYDRWNAPVMADPIDTRPELLLSDFELEPNATHRVAYVSLANGPFLADETVTWTGGSAKMRFFDQAWDYFLLEDLTGTVPTSGTTITGSESGATANTNGACLTSGGRAFFNAVDQAMQQRRPLRIPRGTYDLAQWGAKELTGDLVVRCDEGVVINGPGLTSTMFQFPSTGGVGLDWRGGKITDARRFFNMTGINGVTTPFIRLHDVEFEDMGAVIEDTTASTPSTITELDIRDISMDSVERGFSFDNHQFGEALFEKIDIRDAAPVESTALYGIQVGMDTPLTSHGSVVIRDVTVTNMVSGNNSTQTYAIKAVGPNITIDNLHVDTLNNNNGVNDEAVIIKSRNGKFTNSTLLNAGQGTASVMIDGLDEGVTHTLAHTGGPTGNFEVGESLSWAGGTGKLMRAGSTASEIELLTGSAPGSAVTVTGGSSAATLTTSSAASAVGTEADGSGVMMSNVRVERNDTVQGKLLQVNTSDNTIANCYFSGGDTLGNLSGNRNAFVNNHAVEVGSVGTELQMILNEGSGNRIQGNLFDRVGNSGHGTMRTVNIQSETIISANTAVIGNTFRNPHGSASSGVFMRGKVGNTGPTQNTTITGNQFVGHTTGIDIATSNVEGVNGDGNLFVGNTTNADITAGVTDADLGIDNTDATSDPGTSSDESEGYTIGSQWINVNSDTSFICVDDTEGAAVWVQAGSGGSGLTDPTTTKGDLLVRDSTSVTRLGVGTNGQVLTADSTEATGVKWEDAGSGSELNITTGTVSAAVGNRDMDFSNFSLEFSDLTNFDIYADVVSLRDEGSSLLSAFRFYDSDNSAYTGLRAASAVGASYTFTLPSGVPPGNGYLLTSDTSGNMTYTNPATLGGGTPGGSDGQIQYNNGGSFGGTANLYWDDSLNVLHLGDGITDATPVDGKIQGTGGSGANVAAGDLIIAPGQSTGNATPAIIRFQGTVAGSSGSSAQALSDVVTIEDGAIRGSHGPGGVTSNFVAGEGAGTAITSGTNLVVIGVDAGNGLTTAQSSVVIGQDADGSASNIQSSVLIGNGARGNFRVVSVGEGSIAGSDSIALGKSADANTLDSIALGTNADTTAANQMMVGSSTEPINDLTVHDFFTRLKATVATTDATVTACGSFTTSTDHAYLVTAKIVGVQTTDYSEVEGFTVTGTFKNDGGTLSLAGTVTPLHDEPNTTGWTATLGTSGTDIQALVTGAASTNINWKASIEVIEVD